MFWVWNQGRTDTENELWIDFAVRVFFCVEQVNLDVGNFPLAIWHADTSLEVRLCCTWFSEVGPLHVFVGQWSSSERAALNSLW